MDKPTAVRHDFCHAMKKQTISNSSSQALCLGSTTCADGTKKVVDARHKAWHDGGADEASRNTNMISCLGHCHRSLIGKNQGIRSIGKNRAGQPWPCAWHPRLSCPT